MPSALPQTSAPAPKQRVQVLGRTDDGAVLVVIWPPARCGRCEKERSFFVNRDGGSHCIPCDEQLLHNPEVQ